MSTFRLPCLRLPARSPSGHTGERWGRVHQLARLEQFLDGIDRGSTLTGQGAHPADPRRPCSLKASFGISNTPRNSLPATPKSAVARAIAESRVVGLALDDTSAVLTNAGPSPLLVNIEGTVPLTTEMQAAPFYAASRHGKGDILRVPQARLCFNLAVGTHDPHDCLRWPMCCTPDEEVRTTTETWYPWFGIPRRKTDTTVRAYRGTGSNGLVMAAGWARPCHGLLVNRGISLSSARCRDRRCTTLNTAHARPGRTSPGISMFP